MKKRKEVEAKQTTCENANEACVQLQGQEQQSLTAESAPYLDFTQGADKTGNDGISAGNVTEVEAPPNAAHADEAHRYEAHQDEAHRDEAHLDEAHRDEAHVEAPANKETNGEKELQREALIGGAQKQPCKKRRRPASSTLKASDILALISWDRENLPVLPVFPLNQKQGVPVRVQTSPLRAGHQRRTGMRFKGFEENLYDNNGGYDFFILDEDWQEKGIHRSKIKRVYIEKDDGNKDKFYLESPKLKNGLPRPNRTLLTEEEVLKRLLTVHKVTYIVKKDKASNEDSTFRMYFRGIKYPENSNLAHLNDRSSMLAFQAGKLPEEVLKKNQKEAPSASLECNTPKNFTNAAQEVTRKENHEGDIDLEEFCKDSQTASVTHKCCMCDPEDCQGCIYCYTIRKKLAALPKLDKNKRNKILLKLIQANKL